ncbi:hypothetical protein QVD17_00040 [Tagetes erecta]|uniref:Uncharacterized protein n=1 Tax=Tagetes erecta TaxID=13708 RepID=A0AAD8L760_TARER|nr:hypothetical protein QVD17_00040 [Tagetes erecta]
MVVLKQGDGKENECISDDSWEKWKRGGLIGAAAITGGTLMAITCGFAAPAIASGVSALAPTLGTVMLVQFVLAGRATYLQGVAGLDIRIHVHRLSATQVKKLSEGTLTSPKRSICDRHPTS